MAMLRRSTIFIFAILLPFLPIVAQEPADSPIPSDRPPISADMRPTGYDQDP